MSFRLKLGLAFGTLLVLTVLVALAGIYGMNRALSAQRTLYTRTNRLETKIQTMIREQQAYVNTGRMDHARAVTARVREIRENILSVLALLRDVPQKKRVENVLGALDQYAAIFSEVERTVLNMETMKSRLLHESQRLIRNAGHIEQLGKDSPKILTLINETLMAQTNFMADRLVPTAEKVLSHSGRIIRTARALREAQTDDTTRLYVFRITNITHAYQSVFKRFAALCRDRDQSLSDMDRAVDRFKSELSGYICLVTEKENRFITLLQQWVMGISIIVGALAVLAVLVLSRIITTPINQLRASAARILNGDLDTEVNIPGTDEVAELGRVFNRMTRQLADSFDDLEDYRYHLEELVRERTRKIQKEISEHRATRDALEKEKNRALHYFDIAGSIMVVIDENEAVSLINRAGSRIIGGTKQDIIGKNWFDTFLPDPDKEENRRRFFAMLSGDAEPKTSFESRITTLKGECRIVSWHNSLIRDDQGRISALLGSGEDITDFKQMENERLQLQEKLQQARKMEAIGTLAGGIAHDFNNILFPIIGYTEMAISQLPGDSDTRTKLEQVLRGAMRARDLVQQILAFSRQKQMAKRPINIGPVIKEALKLLRSTIPKNIEITQDIPRNLPVIMGDPTEIYEVVMNLCTNAYHAMEDNGGCLSVSVFEETLSARIEGQPGIKPGPYCILSVKDTGKGILPNVMGQIFDPYFTTKKFGKGSGLGLSVTHGIVKDCGGDILVSSPPGKGTEFKIYLPVTGKKKLARTRLPVTKSKHAGTERILLVDDEDAIVDMAAISLGMMGYRVKGFNNGHDAFQAFSRSPERFDIVVTDMAMPGMVGTTLSKKIKAMRPDIPVIICTGFSEQINADNAKTYGIDGFLKKPMLIDALSAKIRQILDAP